MKQQHSRRRLKRFWAALQAGDIVGVRRRLSRQGTLANQPLRFRVCDKAARHVHELPLFWAARAGDSACVEALLPWQTESLLDENGRSALHWATISGAVQCVEVLLSHDNPLQQDARGWTALMHACELEHSLCAERLLHVSDPKACAPNGLTALHIATQWHNKQIVQLLLPHSDVQKKVFARRTREAQLQGRTAFEIATNHLVWSIADALACAASTDQVREWLQLPPWSEERPSVRLPQWHAQQERLELEAALARGESVGPDTQQKPQLEPNGEPSKGRRL